MPEAPTTKTSATEGQRLRYLEQLSEAMIGLQNANFALLARRSHADANESKLIDIRVAENKAEYARMSAAETLYYAQDARFRPPTPEELKAVQDAVHEIDKIVVVNDSADKIMKSALALINAVKSTSVA